MQDDPRDSPDDKELPSYKEMARKFKRPAAVSHVGDNEGDAETEFEQRYIAEYQNFKSDIRRLNRKINMVLTIVVFAILFDVGGKILTYTSLNRGFDAVLEQRLKEFLEFIPNSFY